MQGKPDQLDVKKLEDRFKEMRFRKTVLPTDKEFIHVDELSPLLKKMLGFGDTLEKKKIKKNGIIEMRLQVYQSGTLIMM